MPDPVTLSNNYPASPDGSTGNTIAPAPPPDASPTPDPLSGLAGSASPSMSSLSGLARPDAEPKPVLGDNSPHKTLNTVLKAVAYGLAGSAAGMASKTPGAAAAAGVQTGIGLAQQEKENTRANQAQQNQNAETQSRVKFQNVQAAEATARAAMYDKQLHNMDTEFQDTHNSRTLQQMKDLQDLGIAPTIIADNHGQGANAALEQLTQSHGGVPHMYILNQGDKLVGYDLSQLADNSAIRDQANKVAEIQGMGQNAYTSTRWGMIGKEGREQLTQKTLGFFMPMATKDNADTLLQQYKNYQQTYAQNPNADPKIKEKLDDTVKLLQTSRDSFVAQKSQEASMQAGAEALARKKGEQEGTQNEIDFSAGELIKPNNLTSLRTLAGMQGDKRLRIYAAAKKLDSNFDPGLVDRKIKFLDEFENPNGKTSMGIDSANTFLQHGADFLGVTKFYRTSSLKMLNTPLNKIQDAFGNAKFQQYKTALDVVRSEYTNAVKAGFAPQAEDAKEGRDILSESSTPAQAEAAVKQMAHTISRRLDSTNQKYKTMMGQDFPNLVTPAGLEASKRLGLDLSKYSSGSQIGAQPSATATPNAVPATVDSKGNALAAIPAPVASVRVPLPPSAKVTTDDGRPGTLVQDQNGQQRVVPAAGETATPQSHGFSVKAWKAANPNGDENQARAAAKAAGYTVMD